MFSGEILRLVAQQGLGKDLFCWGPKRLRRGSPKGTRKRFVLLGAEETSAR